MTGLFYVRFADIRDSDKAYGVITTFRGDWNVQYISPQQFAAKFHPEKFQLSPMSMYEGQVLVKAKYAGLPQHFDAVATGHRIKEALENYGSIVAFEQGMVKDSVAAYRAEYSNVNTIDISLSRLNGLNLAVSLAPKPGYLQMADSHRCVP